MWPTFQASEGTPCPTYWCRRRGDSTKPSRKLTFQKEKVLREREHRRIKSSATLAIRSPHLAIPLAPLWRPVTSLIHQKAIPQWHNSSIEGVLRLHSSTYPHDHSTLIYLTVIAICVHSITCFSSIATDKKALHKKVAKSSSFMILQLLCFQLLSFKLKILYR